MCYWDIIQKNLIGSQQLFVWHEMILPEKEEKEEEIMSGAIRHQTSHEVIQTTTHVQKSPTQYSAAFSARTRVEPVGIPGELELNHRYFSTIPGVLKLVQILICIICMICISPPLTWFSRLFTFVLAYSFAVTILLVFSYLVTLSNVVLSNWNWTFVEVIYTGITSLIYFIMSIVHIALTNNNEYEFPITYYGFYGGYIAAGVFGLLNSVAYGVGTYYLFREWNDVRKHNSVTPVH